VESTSTASATTTNNNNGTHPTLPPTTADVEDIGALFAYYAELYYLGLAPVDEAYVDPNYIFCSGEYGCGGLYFGSRLSGMCDISVICKSDNVAYRGSILMLDATCACMSSVNGLFWIITYETNVFNDAGLFKSVTKNYQTPTDIDYIVEYGNYTLII
jgi:hypothetical protein